MTTDDFTVQLNELYHVYDMSIYPGDLNQELVKAVISIPEKDEISCDAVVKNGELTVRGVTDNGTHTTDVVNTAPTEEVSSVTAQVEADTEQVAQHRGVGQAVGPCGEGVGVGLVEVGVGSAVVVEDGVDVAQVVEQAVGQPVVGQPVAHLQPSQEDALRLHVVVLHEVDAPGIEAGVGTVQFVGFGEGIAVSAQGHGVVQQGTVESTARVKAVAAREKLVERKRMQAQEHVAILPDRTSACGVTVASHGTAANRQQDV